MRDFQGLKLPYKSPISEVESISCESGKFLLDSSAELHYILKLYGIIVRANSIMGALIRGIRA
jgi:hypothetical protein